MAEDGKRSDTVHISAKIPAKLLEAIDARVSEHVYASRTDAVVKGFLKLLPNFKFREETKTPN